MGGKASTLLMFKDKGAVFRRLNVGLGMFRKGRGRRVVISMRVGKVCMWDWYTDWSCGDGDENACRFQCLWG